MPIEIVDTGESEKDKSLVGTRPVFNHSCRGAAWNERCFPMREGKVQVGYVSLSLSPVALALGTSSTRAWMRAAGAKETLNEWSNRIVNHRQEAQGRFLGCVYSIRVRYTIARECGTPLTIMSCCALLSRECNYTMVPGIQLYCCQTAQGANFLASGVWYFFQERK